MVTLGAAAGTSVDRLYAESTESAAARSESSPAGDGSTLGSIANQETFLKLLIAQIKHQDPLNPADSVQFLTQLAQFSELEQLMAIRSEIKTLIEQIEAVPAAPDAEQAQ
jgi:flagellar basal-body rod modification protein FlgD